MVSNGLSKKFAVCSGCMTTESELCVMKVFLLAFLILIHLLDFCQLSTFLVIMGKVKSIFWLILQVSHILITFMISSIEKQSILTISNFHRPSKSSSTNVKGFKPCCFTLSILQQERKYVAQTYCIKFIFLQLSRFSCLFSSQYPGSHNSTKPFSDISLKFHTWFSCILNPKTTVNKHKECEMSKWML